MKQDARRKYALNGKFMAERMQGIVRYARELTAALDGLMAEGEELVLAVPKNAANLPDFRRIKIATVGTRTGLLWEQTDFPRYARRNGLTCVNLCNVAPLLSAPGITCVHDIIYKVRPDFYTTARNRLSRLWHVLQYRYITAHEEKLLTVSEFSKADLERAYPAARGKMTVVPDAWQHVLAYRESADWRQRYPFLREGKFYFSLATLAKNKNGRWILEAAKRNPEATFAVAGKVYETESAAVPRNVRFLGFISDEDAAALMKHCRAFIHPALYEGFGLPPLEALALGAEVIAAKATSLPEVLGNAVHYIDPANPDVDLDALLREPVGIREETLSRYSWRKSAEILHDVLWRG